MPYEIEDDAGAEDSDLELVPDLEAINDQWPGEQPIREIEDAFRVVVELGELGSFTADTHLPPEGLRLLVYHDLDGRHSSDDQWFPRGDLQIAREFPPGALGYAIKHHRPEHRTFSPATSPDELKEHLKLQDTHIQIVVGVERDRQPGVITINNPQGYQRGRFGTSDYPMIFVRPRYPDYLHAELQAAFQANIIAMAACFNTVSEFPHDYNGGDPLAAATPAVVVEHVRRMLQAVAGEDDEQAAAREFFRDPRHLIYCAELAHVATTAGLLVPLNRSSCEPLVGEATWSRFTEIVAAHNRGRPTILTTENDNPWIRCVGLGLAGEDLLPLPAYAPESERQAASEALAFEPMTMAGIVAAAMRLYFPRRELGESMAPVQAAVLAGMKEGLIEAMGLDLVPRADTRRQEVDQLFDQIVSVVARQYPSYDLFRQELDPLLRQADQVAGARPGSQPGDARVVPPCLFHLVSRGDHPDGLLGLDYVGHGLHLSLMRSASPQ